MSNEETIAYTALRSDWYYGGDYMARLIRKHSAAATGVMFSGFPKHWIPLFVYFGLEWRDPIECGPHIPLVSNLEVEALSQATIDANAAGQLRLLVEAIASMDVVVGETLQRIDEAGSARRDTHGLEPIRLTNWHSYLRPEVRAFEERLAAWRPQRDQVAFLPCGRARPYQKSRTHIRLTRDLLARGVDLADYDVVVITSLGPVPEELWMDPTVLRYDTGVRDIYRMLTLLRRLLQPGGYRAGLDCLGFRPYRDLLQILAREGLIGSLERPAPIRARSIPTYRGATTA